MSHKNEIFGGSRTLDAYVIRDCFGDLYEICEDAASELGRSRFHRWVTVYDIRTNKEAQEAVKKIPKITDEAIHALEMANLRGVTVNVIYYDDEMYDRYTRDEEGYLSLYNAVCFLPSKDWKKVHKILLKNGFDINKIYNCSGA